MFNKCCGLILGEKHANWIRSDGDLAHSTRRVQSEWGDGFFFCSFAGVAQFGERLVFHHALGAEVGKLHSF
jgi:hypothetical protein